MQPADPRSDLFRSLSDPTRRALFERLCHEGALSVGALTQGAGVSQPVVSRHIGILRDAGLVTDRAVGRQTIVTAQPGALAPLVDWTVEMTRFWDQKLDALGDLLKRMDQ